MSTSLSKGLSANGNGDQMRGILAIQFIAFVFVLASQAAQAQQSMHQCLELSRQLEQMADAQNKVLHSLVRKNDAVADTLDRFADELGGTGQKVKKADLVSIRQSAKSFRGHSIRESELVEQFAHKTGQLVEQINDCLKHSGYGPETLPQSKVVQNSRDSNNLPQKQ